MTRFTQLVAPRRAKGLRLGLGLDVESGRLPPKLVERYTEEKNALACAIGEFTHEAALAVSDLTVALKPNLAFAEGEDDRQGEIALRDALYRIRTNCPELPVVIDGKRVDIGNSAKGYARRLFGPTERSHFNADAATVVPYMGNEDAIDAFLTEWPDRTGFILCRTSNPGAEEVQDGLTSISGWLADAMSIDGLLDLTIPAVIGTAMEDGWLVPFFLKIACLARYRWNRYRNIGLVVGATAPEQLRLVCKVVRGTGIELLIPGSKTQGGKLEVILPILAREGCLDQATVFISRAALYPETGTDDEHWAEAIEARFRTLHEQAARILA